MMARRQQHLVLNPKYTEAYKLWCVLRRECEDEMYKVQSDYLFGPIAESTIRTWGKTKKGEKDNRHRRYFSQLVLAWLYSCNVRLVGKYYLKKLVEKYSGEKITEAADGFDTNDNDLLLIPAPTPIFEQLVRDVLRLPTHNLQSRLVRVKQDAHNEQQHHSRASDNHVPVENQQTKPDGRSVDDVVAQTVSSRSTVEDKEMNADRLELKVVGVCQRALGVEEVTVAQLSPQNRAQKEPSDSGIEFAAGVGDNRKTDEALGVEKIEFAQETLGNAPMEGEQSNVGGADYSLLDLVVVEQMVIQEVDAGCDYKKELQAMFPNADHDDNELGDTSFEEIRNTNTNNVDAQQQPRVTDSDFEKYESDTNLEALSASKAGGEDPDNYEDEEAPALELALPVNEVDLDEDSVASWGSLQLDEWNYDAKEFWSTN